MNELHLRLFISVRCRRRRPLDLLSTNGFGTGRVSWYASRHVRLNVYKIKRYAHPYSQDTQSQRQEVQCILKRHGDQ